MENFTVDVTRETEGPATVAINGSITAETAGVLTESLLGCLETRPVNVVVDMAAVSYVASPGIGALVSFLRKVKGANGSMVLRGLQPPVLELFRMTHLDKVFDIAEQEPVANA
jgi:anti-sigma B factor antagonist